MKPMMKKTVARMNKEMLISDLFIAPAAFKSDGSFSSFNPREFI